MNKIKNIIFDLGGVLLDIDFKESERAFSKLGIPDFSTMSSLTHANDLFLALETGTDPSFFFDAFRKQTQTTLSNKEIEDALCALLIGYRQKSMEHLLQLKINYRIFLLSNTNEIHVQRFEEMFRQEFDGSELSAYFEAAYYSNRIQKRKPDPSSWLYITERHGLLVEETLFIDDSATNIQAALQLGMKAIQLLPGMNIEDLDYENC
jgi:putative hydrolase of the HAD superfamily